MTIQRRVSEIARKATGPALKRGYLAEEYDGIGSTVAVKLSTGSSSAVLASVAAGAFGTEQTVPAGTVITVLEYQGKLEVVSLGSKLGATAVTSDMLSPELTIRDEFSTLGLSPGGFDGAWSEYISDGLYNSRFKQGVIGTLAPGRGEQLPYWTISTLGSPVVELVDGGAAWPGGRYLHCTFTGGEATERLFLISDPVPVTGGQGYAAAVFANFTDAVNDLISVYGELLFFDANLAYISSSGYHVFGMESVSNAWVSGAGPDAVLPVFAPVAPDGCAYLAVKLSVYKTFHTSNDPFLNIGGVTLHHAPYAVDSDALLLTKEVDAYNLIARNSFKLSEYAPVVSTSSNQTGYDPGVWSIVQFNPGAAINIHGIVSYPGRMLTLFNIASGFDITFIHLSVNAADESYKIVCPNNTNLALRRRGGITLWYDGNQGLWRIISP